MVKRSMTRVFDELSRVRELLGANGQQESLQYDDNNNLTQSNDALWRFTYQSFDALDQLTQIMNPDFYSTDMTYDGRGNLISVSDPRNVVTTYVYDGLDNLIQESSPDAGTTVYYYDAAGNMTQVTDARGLVTQYTYDALGRVLTETHPAHPSEDIVYTYDSMMSFYGLGRLTSVSDESGNTTFEYDERGNLSLRSWDDGLVIRNTGFTYDLSDNLLTMTYPSGRVVEYTRDTLGRILSVTSQELGGPIVTIADQYTYAPFGPATSWVHGNGVLNARTLDQDYRVSAIDVSHFGTPLNSTSYTFDSVDNILDWVDNVDYTRTQNLNYDNLDRLVFATGGYGYNSFMYDANGNRIDDTKNSVWRMMTIDLMSNQMIDINGDPISFDANGNKTFDTFITREFLYQTRNRVKEIRVSGGTIAEYRYNAFGQRAWKEASGQQLSFVYGLDGTLLGEYDTFAGTHKEFIYADGVPLAQVESGSVVYLHTDHLNTPRLATDDLANVVWRWDSDPFGEAAPDEDPDGDSNLVSIPLRFPGQYADAESGEYYNYFRTYNPNMGRYTQSDPIGLDGGINRYAYANLNPTLYADPTGEFAILLPAIPSIAGGLKALAGGTTLASLALLTGDSAALASIADVVDDLNDRDVNDPITIPWPDKTPGKWTCICRAQDPGRVGESCAAAVGYGWGIANDPGTARKKAEAMARINAGGSDFHHTQCKCIGPKGERRNM